MRKRKNTPKDALEAVAKEHGVTVEEVRRSISEAIEAAMKSTDPLVQARWRKMFPDGHTPTPEEMIQRCVMELQKVI